MVNKFVRMRYECGVCKTIYLKRKWAKKCEKRPMEEQKFQIDDKVRILVAQECSICGKYWVRNGTVIEVKLEVAKWEYEYGLVNHVYCYKVKFRCKCSGNETAMYYSPEITPVKKRSKKK